MAKLRLSLTFPKNLVDKPIIYNVGKKYKVITNIRRANINADLGWMVLELEGSQEELQEATDYLKKIGVVVAPIEGDIIEG